MAIDHKWELINNLLFDKTQVEKIVCYINLLQKWGKSYNLTSDSSFASIIEHLIDSIVLAKYINNTNYNKIADWGSGGGFPSIPCAIINPNKNFTAFEVDKNKSTFLRQVMIECDINNLQIKGDYQGDYKKGRENFQLITAKAFLPVEDFFAEICKHYNKYKNPISAVIFCHDIQKKVENLSQIYKKMLISTVLYLPPISINSTIIAGKFSVSDDKKSNVKNICINEIGKIRGFIKIEL